MCLWCNDTGKSFSAAADVQRHMVDKGHCKLLHTGESLVEYDQWYDYSTSYPGEMQQDPESEPDLQVLIMIFINEMRSVKLRLLLYFLRPIFEIPMISLVFTSYIGITAMFPGLYV